MRAAEASRYRLQVSHCRSCPVREHHHRHDCRHGRAVQKSGTNLSVDVDVIPLTSLRYQFKSGMP